MKLILASASPARRELLKNAGFAFDVDTAEIPELRGRGRTLEETVLENARRKGIVVARRHPDAWVLSADTMIEFEGRIHGKPSGHEDGVELLARMAGRTHRLATGVVLRRRSRAIERVAITLVTMKNNSRERIAKIVKTPTRFAGGYAIEERNDPLVDHVEGSFTNVVGLPMEVVVPLLVQYGK